MPTQGPLLECNAALCECMRRGTQREILRVYFAVRENCLQDANARAGATQVHALALAGRECDPDLCKTCLAHNPELNLRAIQDSVKVGSDVFFPETGASGSNGVDDDRVAVAPSGVGLPPAVPRLPQCVTTCHCSSGCLPVKIGRSRTHGWGCFSVNALPKGTHIFEYVGEILDVKTADMRGTLYDREGTSFS